MYLREELAYAKTGGFGTKLLRGRKQDLDGREKQIPHPPGKAAGSELQVWVVGKVLEDRLDLGVEGDVGDALAVDDEGHAI
jgi:hypothetical protein